MSLETAVDNLYTLLSDMTGITRAHNDPPESLNEFPALLVYANDGEYHDTAAGGYSVHTLIAEIYLARQMLAQTVDQAKPFPDRVFSKLQSDRTLSGAVSHMGSGAEVFRYQIIPKRYNDLMHLVTRFEIKVKINH
jgi:hypothetical protein